MNLIKFFLYCSLISAGTIPPKNIDKGTLEELKNRSGIEIVADTTLPAFFRAVCIMDMAEKEMNQRERDLLIELLERDPYVQVREVAADALGNFTYEEVAESLHKAIHDSAVPVRLYAAESLLEFGVVDSIVISTLSDIALGNNFESWDATEYTNEEESEAETQKTETAVKYRWRRTACGVLRQANIAGFEDVIKRANEEISEYDHKKLEEWEKQKRGQ